MSSVEHTPAVAVQGSALDPKPDPSSYSVGRVVVTGTNMMQDDNKQPAPIGKDQENAESVWDKADTLIGRWARFCHDHYYVVVLVWAALSLILLSVVMLAPADERCIPGGATGQMQVCESSEHEWEVTYGESSLRKDALKDAWIEAKQDFKKMTGRKLGAAPERTTTSNDYTVTFVYEYPPDADKADQSIFTAHTVKAMCEHEAEITFHPMYNLFCLLDQTTNTCAEQETSVVRFFYSPSERDPSAGGCKLLSEEEVKLRALDILTNLETSINGFFVNEDAVEGGYTNATRSQIQLGSPLAGYQDDTDEPNEQVLLYDRFLQGWSCPGKDQDIPLYTGPDTCLAVTGDATAEVTFDSPEKRLLRRFDMKGFPDGGTYDGSMRSPYFSKPEEPLPGDETMLSFFFSLRFQESEFSRVVNGDLNYAILSIIVVFLYIWFHVRSAFIAAMCMLQIILCLPIGYFFYYNILQFRYYSQLHILTVYLTLGIGADNVFVLIDAWRQSASNPDIATTVGRLHYTVEREVKACFITTFTTVMSFVATSLNPIMPIHAFAVFAAVVLVFNYLFTVTLSPAVIMIHHVFFSTRGGCCCCGCGAASHCQPMEETEGPDLRSLRGKDRCFVSVGRHCKGSASVEGDEEAPVATSAAQATRLGGDGSLHDVVAGQESESSRGSRHEEGAGVEDPVTVPAQDRMDETVVVVAGGEQGPSERGESVEKLRWAERFFHDKYAKVICGETPGAFKPVAWAILLIFTAYAAVMVWQGLQLSPPSTAEDWFPSSHMLSAELYDRMSKGWWGGTDSEFLSIVFVFGIDSIDRSGFNKFFPDLDRGHVTFVDNFDPTTEAAQTFFISACDEVRAAKCGPDACVYDALVKPSTEANCVIDDLREYYRKTSDAQATHVPPAQFMSVWEQFLTDADEFGSENSTAVLEQHQNKYQQSLGVIDGKIAFVAIRFVSSFPFPSPNDQTHEFYDDLEAFTDRWHEEAPAEMKEVYQTDDRSSRWGFTWMAVEDALVRNLMVGFAICFPVALAVLIFSTGNVVIALYATLSIAFIVAGVLGAIKIYFGWDLGIAESIAGVIVIGFSVDYTVHLGHMYQVAQHLSTREEKTRYALTYIGPTVMGGGLTTLLSATVLFCCTLKFFTKMATLLVMTVTLSVLHAMLFFIALCAIAGPTNGFGDIPKLSTLWNLVRGKSGEQAASPHASTQLCFDRPTESQ